MINLDISKFDVSKVTNWYLMFENIKPTIKIKTNSATATWLKEKFPDITDANIELIS